MESKILRVRDEQKRPFQAEDIKTILQGLDKILSIYSTIVKAVVNPPMIINTHTDLSLKDLGKN